MNKNFLFGIFIMLSIGIFLSFISFSASQTSAEVAGCTDSDNGLNYYEKGSVLLASGFNVTDFCKDETKLAEMICQDGEIKWATYNYNCPGGCVNGACQKMDCVDADGMICDKNEVSVADNRDMRSLAIKEDQGNIILKMDFYGSDGLSETDPLYIYFKDYAQSAASILKVWSNKYQVYWATNPSSGLYDMLVTSGSPEITVSSSKIVLSKDKMLKGDIASFNIWAYWMSSGDRIPDTDYHFYSFEKKSPCVDSDNGANAKVRGTASGYGEIGSIYENQLVEFQDKCWEENGVTEYSCDKDGRVMWQHAPCEYWLGRPGTCRDGMCVPVVECTDSDNGEKMEIRGNISGLNEKGEEVALRDYCHDGVMKSVPQQKGDYLSEFYCLKNSGQAFIETNSPEIVYHKNIHCSGGCVDGVCLEGEDVVEEDNDKANETESSTANGLYYTPAKFQFFDYKPDSSLKETIIFSRKENSGDFNIELVPSPSRINSWITINGDNIFNINDSLSSVSKDFTIEIPAGVKGNYSGKIMIKSKTYTGGNISESYGSVNIDIGIISDQNASTSEDYIEPEPVKIKNQAMAVRLRGRILLMVEKNGESYYFEPDNDMLYYLGKPANAFNLIKKQGVGIKNIDLYKIPIGVLKISAADSDGDGLNDELEDEINLNKHNKDTDGDGYYDKDELESGYNPWGTGKQGIDKMFAQKQRGKIFLQVEKAGEAWYVNPGDGKRYFLGRPTDAFEVMRNLSMGISNSDFDSLR